MRIPIRVTNWKTRALEAEAHRDSLLTEHALAEAENATLRASLDAVIADNRRLRAQAALDDAVIEAHRDQCERIRTWIDTPSSTVRRSARAALAEHLGWAPPAPAPKRHEPTEQVLADVIE